MNDPLIDVMRKLDRYVGLCEGQHQTTRGWDELQDEIGEAERAIHGEIRRLVEIEAVALDMYENRDEPHWAWGRLGKALEKIP